MPEHEQMLLPLPPLAPQIPIHLRSTTMPPSSLLTRLDDARPGDLTALVAHYHADFECNEIVHRHLDAFFLAGEAGPEVRHYRGLPKPMRGAAAEVALAHLYLAGCIHDDILDWTVVPEPICYDAYVVTFAEARIVMDARVLRDPQWLLDEIEEDYGEEIRPCVIEVYGLSHPLVQSKIADRHLRYFLDLLPEDLKTDRSSFRLVHWR